MVKSSCLFVEDLNLEITVQGGQKSDARDFTWNQTHAATSIKNRISPSACSTSASR